MGEKAVKGQEGREGGRKEREGKEHKTGSREGWRERRREGGRVRTL
jgi:hypothetical protein